MTSVEGGTCLARPCRSILGTVGRTYPLCRPRGGSGLRVVLAYPSEEREG